MDDDLDQEPCTCHVVAVDAQAAIINGTPGLQLDVIDSDGDLAGGAFPLGVRASLRLAAHLVVAVGLTPFHR